MFTRLSVEGFKSIRSVDIHLKNPMILIGPNGGGANRTSWTRSGYCKASAMVCL